MIGEMPFAFLPVMFAIAVAIGLTNDKGGAGLSAFLGYIVFTQAVGLLIPMAE